MKKRERKRKMIGGGGGGGGVVVFYGDGGIKHLSYFRGHSLISCFVDFSSSFFLL